MSEYTPTMQELKDYATSYSAIASEAEWDRALAAHDAEVRAATLSEQGEEWEYGYGIGPTYWTAYDREYAEESRRPHERIVRRTKAVPAGPWLPVPTEEEKDDG